MVRQIKHLTKVELRNFLNINVVRYTKDKQKKRVMIGLMAVWAVLIAMLFFYVGALSYGYIELGLGRVLPMYLIAVSSLLIFFFSIFKAGSVIFQKNSYEILCSLPVSQTAIVVSRFFSMYVGNVLLAFAVLIPGMAVYAYFMKPGFSFYLLGVAGTLFIPLLPMTIAALFGALITAISSRMKHKSLVGAGLSILLLLGIMFASSQISAIEGNISQEMLLDLSNIITALLHQIYPPAIWLGTAMVDGSLVQSILYFGTSTLLFIVMVLIISANFQRICRTLYSTTAKHDYQMEQLKTTSALGALYKKELKRYFASSVYVTNTIIGPIMMVAFAFSIFMIGKDQMDQYLPLEGGVTKIIPFALAAVGCIMTTTCTSISMEGKEWWIVKSLPIQAKTIFDSKILMNLTLIAPFYLAAELLLMLALKPGLLDMIWLWILPAIFIVFTCVYGITINLIFPVFQWENEVTVVKQSAASMIGGLGGFLVIILCSLPVILITQISPHLIKFMIVIAIIGITAWLYRKNAQVNLQEIGE
ncbi:hypothetical protein [Pradoshia sp.]